VHDAFLSGRGREWLPPDTLFACTAVPGGDRTYRLTDLMFLALELRYAFG
jgi:hypothetical protein